MNALKNLKSKLTRDKTKKNVNQVIESPQDFDILLGRGKMSFNHVGNRRFRVFIGLHLRRYMDAKSRMEKTLVVNSVVEAITEAGGRFLKQDAKNNNWVQVNAKAAREKVGHALRDAVGIRMKMAASGNEEEYSTQGDPQPFGRRLSEIAQAKAKRNSVTEVQRPSLLLPPEQTRFSRSCGDVINADEVPVRSSMARSAQIAMLELRGLDDGTDDGDSDELGFDELGDGESSGGGSSELMFDPLLLPNKNDLSEPTPVRYASIPAPLTSESTPKLSNSSTRKILVPKNTPSAVVTGGVFNPGERSFFDDPSGELSVMSESTNRKWFDLASGEFSVATVDTNVFDDNDGDKQKGDGIPPHLVEKVSKSLTDLTISSGLSGPFKKGSGFFRRQLKDKGSGSKIKTSKSSPTDIELSEDFSIMSLDTRGKLETTEEFGLKSEEFGLKPEEFFKTGAGQGGLKSEEFGLKSDDFARFGVNGPTVEFDPTNSTSSVISAMRSSSTEFGLRSSYSATNEVDEAVARTSFMPKVAHGNDSASPSSDPTGRDFPRQSSKSKISWARDDVQPKGIMDTVLEGAALDYNNLAGVAGAEGKILTNDTKPEGVVSSEFSVKSADWNTALETLLDNSSLKG